MGDLHTVYPRSIKIASENFIFPKGKAVLPNHQLTLAIVAMRGKWGGIFDAKERSQVHLLLLMEEILHHLKSINPVKQWDKLPIKVRCFQRCDGMNLRTKMRNQKQTSIPSHYYRLIQKGFSQNKYIYIYTSSHPKAGQDYIYVCIYLNFTH